MRRLPPIAVCLLAIVALLAGCSNDEPQSVAPSAEEVRERLAGAPAPLAAIHRQANELLGDGSAAPFERRLRELRGHPVVVNKWAAWCGPCRDELPHFQSQALEHGKRVAFLGVDVEDNDAEATELMERFPLTYPSYRDPRYNISAVFNATAATPSTAFYDSDGELAYLKQGSYRDEEDLAEDIRRYAR